MGWKAFCHECGKEIPPLDGFICEHVDDDGSECGNTSFSICLGCGDPDGTYFCPAHSRRRKVHGHREPSVEVPDTMDAGPLSPAILAARQRRIWQVAEDATAASASRLLRHGGFGPPQD